MEDHGILWLGKDYTFLHYVGYLVSYHIISLWCLLLRAPTSVTYLTYIPAHCTVCGFLLWIWFRCKFAVQFVVYQIDASRVRFVGITTRIRRDCWSFGSRRTSTRPRPSKCVHTACRRLRTHSSEHSELTTSSSALEPHAQVRTRVTWYSSSWNTHLRATERHLPYGITLATQHRWTLPAVTPDRHCRMYGIRFTYSGEMEGWVDVWCWLCRDGLPILIQSTITHLSSNHLTAIRLGVEAMTSRLLVQRPNRYATKPS